MKRRTTENWGRMLAVLACGMLLAGAASAATLDDTMSISGTSRPSILLEGNTQNVTHDTNAPAGYYWGDRLGDETEFAVTPPGLDMGSYSLKASGNGSSLLLNLNSGTITATSGSISGASATDYSSSVNIYSVGNISLGNGELSTLNSRPNYSQIRNSGNLYIGESGSPAGSIQAASVTCGRVLGGGTRGDLVIYSTGSVMITNSAGQIGPFIMNGPPPASGGADMDVKVFHQGSFKAGLSGITEVRSSGSADKHLIVFDGWFGGAGNPTGVFDVTQIISRAENSNTSNARDVPAADLSVVNYASVSVAPGGIETYTARTATGVRNYGTAGSITITNIVNDIEIAGVIDAHSDDTDNPVAKRGILTLQAGGKITLNSLNMSNVQYAAISPGGEAFVEDELTYFVTNSVSGAGTEADPVLTTQTALRVTTNKVVYYVADANTYLAQKVYRIASPAGTAKAGGLLKPQSQTATGTVILIQ